MTASRGMCMMQMHYFHEISRQVASNHRASERNCLINSWRALSTLVLSDTRRPNRAPSHRATPWWDPRIGPVSIYQTVSRRVLLGNPLFSGTRAAPIRYPCIGAAINGISLDAAENPCLSALLPYTNVNEGFI